MSRTMIIPIGDTARDLVFFLEDADGPCDLNGVTPHLYLRHRETGVEYDAAATAVNPTAPIGHAERGQCVVPAAVRAAWLAGEYDVEVEGLYSGGALDIFPTSDHVALMMRARRANLP